MKYSGTETKGEGKTKDVVGRQVEIPKEQIKVPIKSSSVDEKSSIPENKSIDDLLKQLYVFSKIEKLSGTSETQLEKIIEQLLNSQEGTQVISNNFLNPIRLSRAVLRVLVKQIDSKIADYGKMNNVPLINGYALLLKTIIMSDKKDSNARWMALNVYLKNELDQFNILLWETLVQFKDLIDVYVKHIFKELSPEGGLPYLVRLILSKQPSQTRRLIPLVKAVAFEVVNKTDLHELTQKEISNYLTALHHGMRALTDESRIIVQLAFKFHQSKKYFTEELKALLPIFEKNEWRQEIDYILCSNKSVLCTNNADLKVDELAEKFVDSKETDANSAIRNIVEDKTKNKQSSDISLVDDDNFDKELAVLVSKQRVIIRDLSTNINGIDKFHQSINKLKNDNHRLKTQLEAFMESQNKLYEEKLDILKKCAVLEKELREKEQQVAIVRAKYEEEIRIIRGDAEHKLSTFRHKLWDNLKVNFLEAMDESIKDEEMSQIERILLNRIRKILSILKDAGVHN